MPVENIHQNGTLMFNKAQEGTISDCVTSFPGDIHEDDEFDEKTLKLIKDKDESVVRHWRYLTDAKAKAKKTDKAELEQLAVEADLQRQGLTPEALLDSTGSEGDKTVEENFEEQEKKTTKDNK